MVRNKFASKLVHKLGFIPLIEEILPIQITGSRCFYCQRSGCEVCPPSLEEVLHIFPTFSDRGVVFIENLTVLEYGLNILLEIIFPFVSKRKYSFKIFYSILSQINRTYIPSLSFFLMVEMSMGTLMIFL